MSRSKHKKPDRDGITADPEWEEFAVDLAPKHGWRARPGYKVFVFGRGALRLEIPGSWNITIRTESVRFKDRPWPTENIHLEITLLPFQAPDPDLIPNPVNDQLVELLRGCAMLSDHIVTEEQVHHHKRLGLEYAWHEYEGIDSLQKRPCMYRTCIAAGRGLFAVVTFAYWPEYAEKAQQAWEDVMDSIQFGEFFDDPAVGPILH